MKRQTIRLSQLLGKKVYDPSGRCAGRIAEIRARKCHDGACEVEEFLLGRGALLESLSVAAAARFLLHRLGAHAVNASHRVPWNKMDLSNPARPQITCPASDLATLDS